MTLTYKRKEYVNRLNVNSRKYSIASAVSNSDKTKPYLDKLAEYIRNCKIYIRRIDIVKSKLDKTGIKEDQIPEEEKEQFKSIEDECAKSYTELVKVAKDIGIIL